MDLILGSEKPVEAARKIELEMDAKEEKVE